MSSHIVFWIVALCSLAVVTYSTLNMEAACSSKSPIYDKTIWCNNPEDHNITNNVLFNVRFLLCKNVTDMIC
jgi:hypothetical protein